MRIKNNNILQLFFYLVFSVLSCSRLMAQPGYEQLLHKTYAQRIYPLKTIIDSTIIADPDSARVFKKIARFRTFAVAHQDKELILEADMMATYYYKYHR